MKVTVPKGVPEVVPVPKEKRKRGRGFACLQETDTYTRNVSGLNCHLSRAFSFAWYLVARALACGVRLSELPNPGCLLSGTGVLGIARQVLTKGGHNGRKLVDR